MRKALLLLVTAGFFLAGCKTNKKVPDVSAINVPLDVQRFDEDFFALDSNHIQTQLPGLLQKYPAFLPDYIQHILGLSLNDEGNKSDQAIRMFLKDYSVVAEEAKKTFKDFTPYQAEIKKGLQFTKYYFPGYTLPKHIITFIGPLDAIFQTGFDKSGDVITEDALAVGLQLHLGKDAALYQDQAAQALFPRYISQKFTPQTIAVNSIKNVVDDIYPQATLKTLLDHMIDKGKRMYLLDLFLPNTADSLKTGYSEKQLKGCFENEAMIWSFMVQNDLLYNSEPLRIQSYIEEGPYTQELGEGSPGNIALFVGWQIVKKYAENNPGASVKDILAMPAQQLLEASKYKPR